MEKSEEGFVRIYRTLFNDYLESKMTYDEFSLLLLLIMRANPITGIFHTSYESLVNDTKGKYKKNYINKMMLSLKEQKKIWYSKQQGRRSSFSVEIHNYPLSNGSFKDISYRFGSPPGRSLEEHKEEIRAGVPADVELNQQKLKDARKNLKEHFSVNISTDSHRSRNNNNDKENNNKFVDKNFSSKEPGEGLSGALLGILRSSYKEEDIEGAARELKEKGIEVSFPNLKGLLLEKKHSKQITPIKDNPFLTG